MNAPATRIFAIPIVDSCVEDGGGARPTRSARLSQITTFDEGDTTIPTVLGFSELACAEARPIRRCSRPPIASDPRAVAPWARCCAVWQRMPRWTAGSGPPPYPPPSEGGGEEGHRPPSEGGGEES